ncbi:MAG: DUF3363 domain-containing protein [Pseudomonadota bacterium]
MTTEDLFTPRLGKIRDIGGAGGARLRKRATTAAKHLARSGKRSSFSGTRLGRGKASSMQANFAARRYASARLRRVVTKTHIAKPGKVVGTAVFSKHINYLQRDGVERDGSGGELYTREGREVDPEGFTERSKTDRHQFRFIVSPEDAAQIKDLKIYTRELMTIMEHDLGTRLDWVAVDHHNTGRSHTHIVVRGKDASHKDLIIAPDYIGRGFRERASMLATEMLGPRRDLEILRQRARETEQERFTNIDRQLVGDQENGIVLIESASTTKDRFERDLRLQRLKYLEKLRIAEKRSNSEWQLQPGWDEALQAMGKRGDILKAIAAGMEPGHVPDNVRFIEERTASSQPLIGVVFRQGPTDELRDTRFLLVKDFDGHVWYVDAGNLKDGPLPKRGAVVELSRAKAEPRQSDRTIASVADKAGGYYTEGLHAEHDPSSSAAYRLAHKRRLEALQRAGATERLKDGRWRIDQGFLERAGRLEAKMGSVRVGVKSWLPIESQIKAVGETWLDAGEFSALEVSSFETLRKAKQDRLEHLRHDGLLGPNEDVLTYAVRKRMNADELATAYKTERGKSNRAGNVLAKGATFEGVFEDTIDLGQGRFALIGNSKEFTIVPWRKEMERHRGHSLFIEGQHRGVGWRLPGKRKRGISR